MLSFPRVSEAAWKFLPFGQEVNDIQVFRPSPNPLIWLGTDHGVVLVRGSDTLWLHPSNSELPIANPNEPSPWYRTHAYTALDSSGGYWVASPWWNLLYRIDTLGRVAIHTDAVGGLKDGDSDRVVAITADTGGVLLGRANGKIERLNLSGTLTASFRVETPSYLSSLAWLRDRKSVV